MFTEDDYDPGNDIASAAYLAGLAGLLVPTATGLGLRSGDFNVIIFYEQTAATRTVYGRVFPVLAVRAGCAIRVVATEIPALPGP